MIENYKIKGLEKLVNSSAIKDIYPMVDQIDIHFNEEDQHVTGRGYQRLNIDIFLNNDNINKENMYDLEFDPHYLIDYHLKKYFPYFDIDKVAIDFIVWNPNGEIIYSWNN